MEYYCITDIGLIREKNQDSYLCIRNSQGDLLALVADGIGGGKAGEVASGELIRYFEDVFPKSGPFATIEDAENYILYHMDKANSRIYDLSVTYKQYSGMGTTVTGIFISEKGNFSINCGDSRVYGFMPDMTAHLTKDDTLVNQMLEKGEISYEEAINHPKKHYLVKAIGIFEHIDINVHKVKEMDHYLVCSDGLHSYVSDAEIAAIVNDSSKNVEEKVIELKDLALMKGGYDNITIILIRR